MGLKPVECIGIECAGKGAEDVPIEICLLEIGPVIFQNIIKEGVDSNGSAIDIKYLGCFGSSSYPILFFDLAALGS